MGQTCYEKIHARSSPCDDCPVAETIKTKKIRKSVVHNAVLDIWLEITSAPLFDQLSGELINVIVSFQDITEELRHDEEIRIREEFVNDVFTSIQDGIVLIDNEYTILRTNRAFDDMYPEIQPLVGKKCFETSCRHGRCSDCPLKNTFATGKKTRVIHHEPARDGKPASWVEHTAHPIKDESGNVTKAICILSNITSYKEIEYQLADSQAKLGELLQLRTEQLQWSEAKMDAIFNGNVPMVFYDPTGEITDTNPAFGALLGYSIEEIVGQNITNFDVNNDTNTIIKFWDNVETTMEDNELSHVGIKDSFRRETAFRHKNGSTIWIDVNTVAVRDDLGQCIHFAGVCIDITERKKLLESLEVANTAAVNAKKQITNILDHAPFSVILFDKNLNILECNVASLKLFGMPSKEKLFSSFFTLLPETQLSGESSQKMLQEYIEKAAEHGYDKFEWLYQLQSDELLPVEIVLTHTEWNGATAICSYSRDLRNEKALQAERENTFIRMSRLLNSMPLAYHLWNDEMQIIASNDENNRIFAVPDTITFVREFPKFSPEYQPDGRHSATMILEYLTATFNGEKFHFNWDCINAMGETIPTELTLAGFKQGQKRYAVVFVHDLREQQEAARLLHEEREQLIAAKKAAEDANSAKSQFLATMSHEIRTPLNGVIGLSELMLGTELTPKQKEYAQLTKISGESLLFIINDILDFSKIEAGKVEIESENFDLLSTVESVLGILASRAQTKSLELCATFHAVLPRILTGDAGRIRQVLMNLIGNAIKFTDSGGIHVDVRPEKWEGHKLSIHFEVTDTGIGIPEDRIERLFKVFSQADISTSRVYGGTGLGLAIS
ncbi:MAG: PAS domain-containing protein, partial [Thermoguttaceae bacterium]